MDPSSVPIPDRMKHLKIDKRGYPIPVMVLLDNEGTPMFTINDHETHKRLLVEDRCSICGTRLFRGRWFAGGPMSAFHVAGTYIDPPMHHECLQYAMRVCPYLAAPNYSGRIDVMKLDPTKTDQKTFIDPTMIPERPRVFVCVMAIKQEIINRGPGRLYVRPIKPYKQIEYWRHGLQLAAKDGEREAEITMKAPIPVMRGPRLLARSEPDA